MREDLPPIEGDVNQIQQIIMNLITNASESIGDKSGVISLSSTAMFYDHTYLDAINDSMQTNRKEPLGEGVYVCLEVSDTGCGMDPETQERVFDPFFTTKFAGRGLGMAAALGIVRGHDGAIKIYSEKGKGTTFKVLFPAKGSLGTHETQESVMEQVLLWPRGATVLVADDEDAVCIICIRSGGPVKHREEGHHEAR